MPKLHRLALSDYARKEPGLISVSLTKAYAVVFLSSLRGVQIEIEIQRILFHRIWVTKLLDSQRVKERCNLDNCALHR